MALKHFRIRSTNSLSSRFKLRSRRKSISHASKLRRKRRSPPIDEEVVEEDAATVAEEEVTETETKTTGEELQAVAPAWIPYYPSQNSKEKTMTLHTLRPPAPLSKRRARSK